MSPMTNSQREVIVIGAGISGLVCAYRLKKRGIDVLLIEKAPVVGGVIQSEHADGYLIEKGPNSSQGTPELLELVDELGGMDDLLEGDPKAPAYVYFRGRLHSVPSGAGAFVASRLLSVRGKLRLLAEPFVAVRREPAEESVASFARRRIGREAAARLVAPFVSGIYAGDANNLSVQAAFPRLANLESTYGGLFRGMIAKAREARRLRKSTRDVVSSASAKPKRMVSFKDGMSHLPRLLASGLGEDLMTGITDCALSFSADGSSGRRSFAVRLSKSDGRDEIVARHVVISTPAAAAARLVEPLSGDLSGLLSQITYPPLAIVHLAYPLDKIRTALYGFGFLVAPEEALRILGCVWNSSLFAFRAPPGNALLTVFMGGARQPELLSMRDDELISLAHNELGKVLVISSDPVFKSLTRYRASIPQYKLGHAERVQAIESLLEKIPGLHLASNYLHGVSTGDCIKQATGIADKVSFSLGST